MDYSTYFDRVPEIDKANEEYQIAIKKLLNKEITFEECMKYKEAVSQACNNFGKVYSEIHPDTVEKMKKNGAAKFFNL